MGVCVVKTQRPRTDSMSAGDASPTDPSSRFGQQGHGHQRGVPLVEMEFGDICVAESAQHRRAGQPEDRFLGEPLERLAGVEAVGNRPRIGVVAGNAGIEEVHRDRPAVDTDEVATPHSDGHRTASDHDLNVGVESFELVTHLPADDTLHLTARMVDLLAKESFVVHQGHAQQGDREVRGGPEEVTGQDAQTTAEAGYPVADGDLHGEVRDGHRLSLPYQRAANIAEVCPLES